jgi:hypothetical protein
MGRCQLLGNTFRELTRPCDSFAVGDLLIQWLLRIDVEVEACIGNELIQLPDDLSWDSWVDSKKIIFEPRGKGGWRLGFEWVFDYEAPGHLLAFEYQALVIEYLWTRDWPFVETVHMLYEEYHREQVKKDARFDRRIAAKARKERARTGQKLSRSRMPGEWVW